MTNIQLLMSALSIAAQQHNGQKRKDLAGSPYINHPIAVASLLAGVGNVQDPEVLTAALLHDVAEDTDMTLQEISVIFGHSIAHLVAECTDDKSLPKEERKRLQIEHAPHKSIGAKLIKIADKISNCRDIVSATWETQRKLEYLDWSVKVVAGLRGVNEDLDALFDDVVASQRVAIKLLG